jgi:hypothetical protein
MDLAGGPQRSFRRHPQAQQETRYEAVTGAPRILRTLRRQPGTCWRSQHLYEDMKTLQLVTACESDFATAPPAFIKDQDDQPTVTHRPAWTACSDCASRPSIPERTTLIEGEANDVNKTFGSRVLTQIPSLGHSRDRPTLTGSTLAASCRSRKRRSITTHYNSRHNHFGRI